MRGTKAVVFAMLLVPFAGFAQMYRCFDASGAVSIGDKPCKTNPAPAGKQGESFTTNILIVQSHADIESWVKLGPAQRGGDAGRARTVAKGAKVYLPVVATFRQSQSDQRIALVADLEIIAPGGRTQRLASCCSANRVDPRAPATIVLNPVIDITFDAKDPKGEYRVRARINNGRQTAVAEETFRLQ